MLAKTTISILAALAAAVCVPAYAADREAQSPDTVSVTVSLADLNLASAPGAERALRRIRNAAEWICGERPNAWDLNLSALHRACMRSTTDRAVAALNSPMVTALNSGTLAPRTVLAAKR